MCKLSFINLVSVTDVLDVTEKLKGYSEFKMGQPTNPATERVLLSVTNSLLGLIIIESERAKR